MAHARMKLDDVKDSITFAELVCSQCNLCFRTPNDPDLFCFPKFVRNRMEFINEFVLQIVHARKQGKAISPFRTIKKFREIFCHKKTGICTVNKDKCNKRKRKRCFRAFSDQVLLIDLESTPIKQSKKKKKKKKQKQKAKGKKVYPIDGEEDYYQDGYGRYCGFAYQSTADTPEMTVIGKKKFQNKVDKILDEDTD